MAGSDFSTYPYSYDDFPGDVTLSNFNLTQEDLLYKVIDSFYMTRFVSPGIFLYRFLSSIGQRV